MSHRTSSQFTLLVLLVCSGCGNPVTTTGSQGISWVSGRADAIPGIDAGSVNIVTIRSAVQPLTFVLWTDSTSGGSSSSGNGIYERTTKVLNGVAVQIRCETPDGQTGIMTIDGQQFDLTNGVLFLISAVDGEPKVLQLDHDMAEFPTDMDEIKSLAKNNQQIREFFTGTNANEQP